MSTKVAYARMEDVSEVNNLLCCLEFLAEEAHNSQLTKVHKILKQAISEVYAIKNHEQIGDMPFQFQDVLSAFKFFLKFCMVEDKNVKKSIMELLESLNAEVMKDYVL